MLYIGVTKYDRECWLFSFDVSSLGDHGESTPRGAAQTRWERVARCARNLREAPLTKRRLLIKQALLSPSILIEPSPGPTSSSLLSSTGLRVCSLLTVLLLLVLLSRTRSPQWSGGGKKSPGAQMALRPSLFSFRDADRSSCI